VWCVCVCVVCCVCVCAVCVVYVCGVCVCGVWCMCVVCVCPSYKFWTILPASEKVVTELIPDWKSQNLKS